MDTDEVKLQSANSKVQIAEAGRNVNHGWTRIDTDEGRKSEVRVQIEEEEKMRVSSVKSAEDRFEKWNRKMKPVRVKEILEEELPTMRKRAREMFLEQSQIEDATKQVMGQARAPIRNSVSYLNFARQLWKADRTYSGKTLMAAAQQLVDAWAQKGLDRDVLDAIRDRVFTIPAPTGP